VHTGAAQAIRVWPLERFQFVARRLRETGRKVKILCNQDQVTAWRLMGETDVKAPTSIAELLSELAEAEYFIGNDSGPGHLAAFCGIPTFTVFGPQVPEWFRPLHPASELIEGKACPYKPCSDYCRYPRPHCLWNIEEEEVWQRVKRFIERGQVAPAGTANNAAGVA